MIKHLLGDANCMNVVSNDVCLGFKLTQKQFSIMQYLQGKLTTIKTFRADIELIKSIGKYAIVQTHATSEFCSLLTLASTYLARSNIEMNI